MRIIIDTFDSQEDGGENAPQGPFLVQVLGIRADPVWCMSEGEVLSTVEKFLKGKENEA